MSVLLAKSGIANDHDSYEFVLTDGDRFAVVGIDGRLLRTLRGLELCDVLAFELKQTLARLAEPEASCP